MRPFRSFLLLLILFVCLTGLFNIFPGHELFIKKTESRPPGVQVIYDTLTAPPDSASCDPLAPFIDSLRYSRSQVRIMYYGDSQVEGDRITFYLRQLLRQGHEGTGPGLFLPVMPVMYTKTLWIKSSPNWRRYNYLSYKSGALTGNDLGPFLTVCRYLPDGEIPAAAEKAGITIRPSAFADSASSIWERMRIFYYLKNGNVKIRIMTGDQLLVSDSLHTGGVIRELVCDVNKAEEINIEFEGRTSPDIYGISLESTTGIIVDNIPQRGSAGLEFSLADRDNLKEIYSILSPDLIILHYGLNIVRNIKADYSYFKSGLRRQIEVLKQVAPATPVLVIGVTDMARNEGDSIRSYENIPAIIRAQKDAATESGAAFWDSYSAMGGGQSIVKWSKQSPPLAQGDYAHFTYSGADTISRMLRDAILSPEEKGSVTLVSDSVQDTSGNGRSAVEAIQNGPPDRNSKIMPLLLQALIYDQDKPFVFSAPAFWLFLLLVLAGYSLIYRKLFIRNFYLLLVSLFFYYKTGGLFLFLLIFVTIIDFACGYLIFRSGRKSLKWIFILLSLVSNLGILAYFKYTGFIIETVNNLAGTDFRVYDFIANFSNTILGSSFDISNIILPAGISFFTFQSLSYTIDIYRGKLEPVRNIFDFGFYVSFFPQLVAGPIVRASEFIPQMYSPFNVSKREFSHALFLVSKGLIKKIVISDFIAVNLVDRVFDMPSVFSGFENLMAVYGYGLQIYCDFSGYTDIAIGVALVLGFRLPVNFNSPYKAAGITDFWKRWHISLSRWLKDYLYISLGGNRKGRFRTGINLMVTMLLGGLWHGAAIRFIIWGALHGIGLIIGKVTAPLIGCRLRSSKTGRFILIFLTFNFVSFCWIFFRASGMNDVFIILRQITGDFSPGSFIPVLSAYSNVFLLMAAGYLMHFLPEATKEAYRGLFIRIPLVFQLAAVFLAAVLILQMRMTDVMPFIYFRF